MSKLRFRYQTFEFGEQDIHVRCLRDTNQYADDQGIAAKLGIDSGTWSHFGVLWDAGKVLAHHMQGIDVSGKRILEVGCGMALSSLLLNSRGANITATDHHPQTHHYLQVNTGLNCGKEIPFVRTGWADKITNLGEFDLIIGSDLLYEPNHADLLSAFIHQHAAPSTEVIIVDPGRRQRARFSQAMRALGYVHSRCQPETSTYGLKDTFKGYVLVYKR